MPAQNRPMINATASIILTHPYYALGIRLMAGVSFKTPLHQPEVTVSCLPTPGAPCGGSIARPPPKPAPVGSVDSANGMLIFAVRFEGSGVGRGSVRNRNRQRLAAHAARCGECSRFIADPLLWKRVEMWISAAKLQHENKVAGLRSRA
jgi:hypothetical protein